MSIDRFKSVVRFQGGKRECLDNITPGVLVAGEGCRQHTGKKKSDVGLTEAYFTLIAIHANIVS
jgi:hypothetical protein